MIRNPVPEFYSGDERELPVSGPILNRVDLVAAEDEVSLGDGGGRRGGKDELGTDAWLVLLKAANVGLEVSE